jgi:ATP-dependent DNA ligase
VLRPAGVTNARWEPKLDGWRAVWVHGRLWSRRGADISRLFPDLVSALSAQLPPGVIVDGEAVVVDSATNRIDFASLSRRLTAGRRLVQLAASTPAQLVCFDLIAAGGAELRTRPLQERRRILERTLAHARSPIVLCEHSADPVASAAWFDACSALGIEGLVIKTADGCYPIRAGCRVWYKLKRRHVVDLVVTAVVGDPAEPGALVLSCPTGSGPLRTVGTTTRLSTAVARELGWRLYPTGTAAR